MHFVVATSKAEVRLYHVDGTLVHTFKGHTGSVLAVAATPDGQHIISGAGDKLVKVWSVATKSLVSTCEGHSTDVRAVAAMPDGQRILSGGSNDGTVRVWLLDGNRSSPVEHGRHQHFEQAATGVALPDNQHALSASYDNTVKLFNANDGAVLRTFKHHTRPGALPGAAARRPPIRQRLGRRDRVHRRARARALRSVEILSRCAASKPSRRLRTLRYLFTTLWKVRFGLGNSRSMAARPVGKP